MDGKVNTTNRGYILLVGKAFATLRDYVTEHNLEYILLKDAQLVADTNKRYKRVIPTDFSSQESVLAATQQLQERGLGKPTAVIATYENYILPAAWLAEHFELNGLPVTAAEACTDKQLMRQLFAKAPEQISPAFAVVTDEANLREFAAEHQFPLILKPANLAKSLLVTKSVNEAELLDNYHKAIDTIQKLYDKHAPQRQPKLLVEEFLEGRVHSVDAFVDSNGTPHVMEQIVDYQTGYDIGFDDNFHYSRIVPSTLSREDQTKLRHVAELGCRALGMRSTPAHIEIIMTPAGPRIVEIGARNGGYRERMFKLSNDIDITGNAIAVATGQPLDLQAKKTDPVAVLELFPKQAGNFSGLANEDALKALPSLTYLSVKVGPGQPVGKSADGFKAVAIIILHNADDEQFAKDLQFVNTQVSVQTSTE